MFLTINTIGLASANVTFISMSKQLFEYSRKDIIIKAIQEVRLGLVGCLPTSLQYCINTLEVQSRNDMTNSNKGNP